MPIRHPPVLPSDSPPRQGPDVPQTGPVSALEPHERSHSALGAGSSLEDAFPQKCVQKVSLTPSALCVPTASSCLQPCGLLSTAPSLRSAVSQWLQRRECHSKIFHGFISRARGLTPHLTWPHPRHLTHTGEGQSQGTSFHLSNRSEGDSHQAGSQGWENYSTSSSTGSHHPLLLTTAAPRWNPAAQTPWAANITRC